MEAGITSTIDTDIYKIIGQNTEEIAKIHGFGKKSIFHVQGVTGKAIGIEAAKIAYRFIRVYGSCR